MRLVIPSTLTPGTARSAVPPAGHESVEVILLFYVASSRRRAVTASVSTASAAFVTSGCPPKWLDKRFWLSGFPGSGKGAANVGTRLHGRLQARACRSIVRPCRTRSHDARSSARQHRRARSGCRRAAHGSAGRPRSQDADGRHRLHHPGRRDDAAGVGGRSRWYIERLSAREPELAQQFGRALAALGAGFAGFAEPEQVEALRTLERTDPPAFAALRDTVYEAYYTNPAIWPRSATRSARAQEDGRSRAVRPRQLARVQQLPRTVPGGRLMRRSASTSW